MLMPAPRARSRRRSCKAPLTCARISKSIPASACAVSKGCCTGKNSLGHRLADLRVLAGRSAQQSQTESSWSRRSIAAAEDRRRSMRERFARSDRSHFRAGALLRHRHRSASRFRTTEVWTRASLPAHRGISIWRRVAIGHVIKAVVCRMSAFDAMSNGSPMRAFRSSCCVDDLLSDGTPAQAR